MDLSIIIIGKICSGKSTLAKDFSNWLKMPIASFGKYLAEHSRTNGLKVEREALQDLGESFIKDDYSQFLDSVIDFTGKQNKKMIFEGVRHRVIFDKIKSISNNTLSIYLDCKEDVRYERFLKREKEIDSSANAEVDFYRFSSHSVEKDVENLKDECDFIITSNKSYQYFLKMLSLY